MPTASPIDDIKHLPGSTVYDQLGRKLGEVKEIYAQDGEPMWVTVQSSTGLASDRLVFIPLARLKEEDGKVQAPYSAKHLNDSPEIDAAGELSEEDDHRLRAYYSVGIGDGELRTDNDRSYASRVPEAEGPVTKASDED
jgi:hypothetical protein